MGRAENENVMKTEENSMKKGFALLLAAVLLAGLFSGAAVAEEKIKVVTTIFPIYDWVRQIAGDTAEVSMLLDSGADLHNFQPTAADILDVAAADLFIYVGGESDEWVEDVLKTAMNPRLKTLSLVEAMGENIKMEEIVEGMEHDDHDGHDHDEDHDEDHEDHEDHDHGEDHGDHDHDHDEHEVDEHVWLSLRNAQALCQAIGEAMTELAPANAEAYRENLSAYQALLARLDEAYAEAVEKAAHKTILFGDRFPFRYLADDYGLSYYAAFSGCSAESEASFQTIVFLAQKVDELGLTTVMTIENPKARIAETVVAATQGKNQKILALDSLQSITARDVQNGASYLSVMESNLEVLKEALN